MNYTHCLFVILIFIISCSKKKPLFELLSSKKTGITFNNNIIEDEVFNVMNYEYLYNGGGVGVGDFNNDGLQDIYFTGSLVSNTLYINKGNMTFTDATKQAKVSGEGKWCKGVSVVDINNDGLLDLYLCAGVLNDTTARKNILYINKGVDKVTGIPIFANEAEAYGLADMASSQMAAFFDYDKDGDLDVYILENDLDGSYANTYRPIVTDGSKPNTDKLFRNDWHETLKHGVFTNVSKQAGIQIEGYGLGVHITDINNDGWPDIYVSNDYLSNNLLYVNNKNGTFTDKCADYFKHTSKNAMGNDIADINNDGLQDIIELDMAPADNYRQKMMMNDISYQTYQNNALYGYITQYARNSLQLNMGMRNVNDSTEVPVFSEIAYSAGIAQTDWSWAPLLVDVDNDGYKDVMISNGLPKDMSDQDYISYRNNPAPNTSRQDVLAQLPSVKIPNYIYKNNGNASFTNKTEDWGWNFPTFSAGMAYVDLDNDGDMDCVINNTNMEASVLENKQKGNNYIQLELLGDSLNRNALGSIVHVYADTMHQVTTVTPYRGYISSVTNMVHIGLGIRVTIDSIVVQWPNNRLQKLTNIGVNKKISIAYSSTATLTAKPILYHSLYNDVTGTMGLSHIAREEDFIDFDIQRLLPHKLTQYGPAMAVGDVNGDGLEDLIIGGGAPLYATLFTQLSNGSFIQRSAVDSLAAIKYNDDGGLCLFDADNDNDLDLYIASGGAEMKPQHIAYADCFYINDGKGNFSKDSNAIPNNYAAKSCVKATDYDNDGDIDLFIGTRVVPTAYPKAESSILLRNDSKNGRVQFTDVTKTIAPDLQQAGMICDAIWTDINNDNSTDLILVGEFTPITILQNNGKTLQKQQTNIDKELGWWNSISGADMDNDGDIDYVVGNFGTNSFLQASNTYPVIAWGNDFDNNESYNTIIGSYNIAAVKGKFELFPVASRDEFIKEMSILKGKFPNYKSYATTPLQNIFNNTVMKQTLQLQANNFNTCWLENKGDFNFALHALPMQMQWAPIYGLLLQDVDGDGNIDILSVGNEFGMNPYLGKIDAYQGLLCKGNGKGGFAAMSIAESGFYVPGSGKSLAQLFVGNKPILIAGQNKAVTKCFEYANANTSKPLAVKHNSRYAIVTYKNGVSRREEFYYGNSFQSQSSRRLLLHSTIASVTIFSNNNEKTIIDN